MKISFLLHLNSFSLLLVLSSGCLVKSKSTGTTSNSNCFLQWNSKLPSWFPLIWNGSSIVYPKKDNTGNWSINFTSRESLNVGCSDIKNNLKNFDRPVATLKCSTKGEIKVGAKTINFEDLGCTDAIQEQVVQVGQCNKNFENVTIKFESPTFIFPLLEICHDPKVDATAMAHHTIHGGALNNFEISNKRPGFKESIYFKQINANQAYGQKSQLNFLTNLLNSQRLAEKYIDKSKSFYFARGHLAPDGDFVHIYEQNATYYFINVIPQWQSINNGNWKSLESAVKRYAISKQVDLKVWTGSRGILKLPNEVGNLVEIYLAQDSSGKLRLPVPEITWKVIHEPVSNSALALFTVNNPHLESVSKDLILCPDICSKIPWVKWKTDNIKKGYSYCCDLKSASKFLDFIPNLNANNLLV